MTEKQPQLAYPMAPAANGYSRSDAEAGAHDAREQRKKKRTKCLLYIVLFAIFQAATFENINAGTPASPAFSARMNTELGVKNANFGRYKYRNTTVVFFYRDTPVGQAILQNSRVNWRATKKIDVAVDLNLGNAAANSQLGSDLSAGIVPITSQARMTGRVELVFVMKKNKATEMKCNMEIVTATQQLRNIVCK
ncbi:hypothetical protein Sango_2615600 [Sesamum angolense]|uniref:Late embryogenesis abundant protein LEA-2 subgroup domain-containing protein n=1 Tax=Sesamum angolense TaxID=2727404 RepID=A0AAE1TBM5_9LAMI|nr:hypothetical protein Sango_2615600 [Sesamum angolense]